jgi:site-specific DNA recombinase
LVNAHSRSASLLRPGLQGLIAGATAKRFGVVVAEALDRLSRDQADVAALYKRLTFAGVNTPRARSASCTWA